MTRAEPLVCGDGAGGVLIRVKAVPGSKRDEIAGVMDYPDGPRLKVKTSAPPEGGKANRAIAKAVARAVGAPGGGSAGEVVRGMTSPEKTVRVVGVDAETALRALGV